MRSTAAFLPHASPHAFCALRRSLSFFSLLSAISCVISSPCAGSMASALGAAVTISALPRRSVQEVNGLSSIESVSICRKSFPSIRVQPPPLRFQVSCPAKKETLDKVCEMVKKHLALPGHAIVAGNSKFSELGVDSLDTVEIAMGFEDAFGISLQEETVQSILTVQDAADMIEEHLSES